MIYGLYSIRDVKTGFLTPSLDMNGESAIRNFEHAILNTSSLFYTHPSDYSLYHIADFDTDTGVITPLWPIIHLCDAVSIKKGE